MTPEEELEDARGRLNTAREAIPEKLYDVAKAQVELNEAKSRGADAAELAAKQQALDDAKGFLQTARTAVNTEKGNLATLLAAWVSPSVTPATEFGRLDASVPIVFLPVRLETKFMLAQGKLRIRVYPDDIFGSTHEEAVTQEELDAAQAFHNSPQELTDWQTFIQGRSPQRAVWVMQRFENADAKHKLDNWTMPSEANLLPDRWIAVGVRPDGVVVSGVGTPIQEPLQLSYDPSSDDDGGTDPLPVEAGLKWTVDFEAARTAGMALEIDANASGFDRLLVFGVKSSMTPARSAEALRKLIRDHRYSRGMALVAQGTPTNNTGGRDAGYPLDDRGGEVSFRVDWQGGLEAGKDGAVLSETLGLADTPFDDVFGADGQEQMNAAQMNRVLWPISFGYFLQHMLDPVTTGKPLIFEDDVIGLQARPHFEDHVRGRGTCPVFRVGAVPYGVQVVSSLDLWKSPTTTGLEAKLPPKLKALRTLWLAKAQSGAARINRNPNDPDSDLLSVIGLHPSTRQVRVRPFVGDAFQRALFQLRRLQWGPWSSALAALAKKTFDLIGEGGNWNVRIGRASASPLAPLFKHPLVAPEPLSEELDANGRDLDRRKETVPIKDTYIDTLAAATVDALRTGITPAPQALLYHLLRHATLTEYARLAYKELNEVFISRTVLELVRVVLGLKQQRTVWDWFEQDVPSGPKAKEWVMGPAGQPYRDALAHLAGLSQAELERLLTETLDVASHRLDAWITSIFARRLHAQRLATGTAPTSHLGAFAWVENLRPASTSSASGGYIHAPSIAHAATAGILRSGFLTRKGESAGRFSFDLSSDRVRVARGLLQSVRGGQPAGAVLGYRFERALHDGSFDRFIDPVRKKYPLVANKAQQGSESPEAIAARNVVDGLALRLAWQGRTSDDAFITSLGFSPAPSPAEKAGLLKALTALDEAVDGVADLLTAESVFQMVRGNAPGATAPLDALAAGAHPPDPEVARTPRGGTAVVHRLVWLWNGDPGADDGAWSSIPGVPPQPPQPVSTRRAEVDRVLDDWVGEILGRPEDALCWVTYTDDNDDPQRKAITFRDLKVRPLDVLALAEESGETNQELSRRILMAAVEDDEVRLDDIAIDFEPGTSSFDRLTQKTFPELLALARQINALLGRARPGRPVDLLPVDGSDPPALSAPEVLEYTDAVSFFGDFFENDLTTLKAAITSGDEEQLIAALRRAGDYLSGAFPDPRETQLELQVRAELVEPELSRRFDVADQIVQSTTLPEDKTPEKALEIYRALFGRSFLRVSHFTLDGNVKKEIETSISGLTSTAHQPGKFLQQNARVRPALAGWRKLWLHAGTFKGAPVPTVDMAQLPFIPGEKWAGDDGVPAGTRLSLLLAHTGSRPDLTASTAALVIDELTEIIPASEEQTGLAFHYDNPGAEAAQAILVGVCPEVSATKTRWTFDEVKATLGETFDLAKVRAVEPTLIGETRQALPALYLTANATSGNPAASEAIATNFTDLLQDEPVHVPR